MSEWSDKSGNNRDFTQETEIHKPTTGAATQNGLNLLSFSGNQTLLGPTTPNLSELPVEVFVAGDVTTTGTWFSQTDFGTVNLRQFQLFKDSGESVASRVRGNLTIVARTPNINRFRVAGIVWKSSGSTLIDGNTSNALDVGSAAVETGVAWKVGARGPDVSFALNGTMGEVILFTRELTLVERTEVLQYLSIKWSITL